MTAKLVTFLYKQPLAAILLESYNKAILLQKYSFIYFESKVIKLSKIVLYHGSNKIVSKPQFGDGKPFNDYGQGFYCTKHLNLAKEWAVEAERDGFVNVYEIDDKGLKILNLSVSIFSD